MPTGIGPAPATALTPLLAAPATPATPAAPAAPASPVAPVAATTAPAGPAVQRRAAGAPPAAVGPVVVQRRPDPVPAAAPEPPRATGGRPAGGSTTVGLFGAPVAPTDALAGGEVGPPGPGPATQVAAGQALSTAPLPDRTPLPDPALLLESLERRHLDDLARRLAEPLGRLFRSELRLGRERGGRLLDGGR
ncbi:hypothetical protein OG689_30515 [Kitasatospora sp. NBC_00240]|uniref:hypothetical protein n=1 Tax=Kitasatospora sp. NBC_00240 TaxID=2903567 RepID=UPI0022531B0C|nr:hypothetical protein [Kitasatospora sp. NBC_00240]MCX5213553.1 hypothetical protein [Kitasatospora sp. NBC_00240]